MRVDKYLDFTKLNQYVSEKYIDLRVHPTFPLGIYTYSRKTIFDNFWDDVTEKCRGLIVNLNTLEIVARPFEKFFNLDTTFRPETHKDKLPKPTPIIMEKLDGSLGIGYQYNDSWFIASKGSFTSDHATWATAFYKKHMPHAVWPEGYTPVFEMVCQGVQHHVVHYKQDGLYLIALINKETGEELDYNSLYQYAYINGPHLKLPKVYTHMSAEFDTIDNEEGYVLSWPRHKQPPLKIKVKLPNFLRKQKIMHGTGPKQILELLEQGKSLAPYMTDTTPEFESFVLTWKLKLEQEFSHILGICGDIYNDAVWNFSGLGKFTNEPDERKKYAMYFLRSENKKYSGVLFAMLDEDVDEIKRNVWKLVRPMVKDAKPFVMEED